MKKLMIAAAVAAMGAGAFAGICDNKGDAATCALYDVKFTFKSLDTKRAVQKESDKCSGSTTTCCTYLDNATYTFNGIMWDCDAVCDMLDPNNANGGTKLVLWYAKAKAVISEPLKWGNSSGAYAWEGDIAAFEFINRFSKKATKVQAYWEQDFNAQYLTAYAGKYNSFGSNDEVKIRAAGFGTFDNKNMIVKSISGNAVATIGDILLKEQDCGSDGPEPKVYDLCTEFDTVCDGTDTDVVAASGTWSVKYNKSLSKGSKTLNQIVPAYAYQK